MTRFSISWLIGSERVSHETDSLTPAAIAELVNAPVQQQTCISGPGFVARLVMSSRWAVSAKPEWRLRFDSPDEFKSSVCVQAESAGVRYASHRKGHVASRAAFRRFLTSMAEAG